MKFSATDPAPAGPVAGNVDINASGTTWTKTAVPLNKGDKITWHFPSSEITGHDV